MNYRTYGRYLVKNENVSTYGADGGYEIMDGFKLTKQIAGTDDYMNIITALKGFCTAYENEKINATLEKALSSMQGGEQRIFDSYRKNLISHM